MTAPTPRPASLRRSGAARARRDRRSQPRLAFTLLEIIVVVTIIALLATLVAPRLLSNIWKAKQKVAQSEVSSLATQVGLWMADNGYSRVPDDFELDALLEGDDPFLNNDDDLTDPWNNRYVLINPGNVNRDFDIMSYGADGTQGGEGENKDVVN